MNRSIRILAFVSCAIFSFSIVGVSNAATKKTKTTAARPAKNSRMVMKKNQTKMQNSTMKNPGLQIEAKRKDSLSLWLERMKKRVAKSQAKHNRLVAVAAVRGDEAPDSPPLYWKGKTPVSKDAVSELTVFEQSIQLALDGDRTLAKNKLTSFLSDYPQSPLAPDAKQTLALLTEETPEP